jgi:hypothetical protein
MQKKRMEIDYWNLLELAISYFLLSGDYRPVGVGGWGANRHKVENWNGYRDLEDEKKGEKRKEKEK